jgi:hypothetical protein
LLFVFYSSPSKGGASEGGTKQGEWNAGVRSRVRGHRIMCWGSYRCQRTVEGCFEAPSSREEETVRAQVAGWRAQTRRPGNPVDGRLK